MTPNSMYADQSLRGGIHVTSADVIKIFCDIDVIKKISRSIIKIERNKSTRHYMITSSDIALKINGTAVRVRAISSQPEVIYLFDQKTDAFIGQVKEFIKPYGDKASIESEGDDRSEKQTKRVGSVRKNLKSKATAKLETIQDYNPPVVKSNFDIPAMD
ncbi:MAG TPA: hypothetical protein PKL56_16935 [Cyclobacteriaceae bacterium]|nr:hypothetical protein [Cyclobacteriaceae bacterium]HMV09313.1 hypothetical protein [Cyclobacteriaceae bacterium]HMX01886.1 hypothetical protein [Cyclobacteriaceae bacterium]HMX50810.1 hypothetical protein [Cyclobacteriaceae bacterium]HMY94710.1 hypothetical protein [Cyclobacteriaceae bacterium]